MEINGKQVKSIRPMTISEKAEYFNDSSYLDINVFCIEFDNGSILLPKGECVNCMLSDKCLFTLIQNMP